MTKNTWKALAFASFALAGAACQQQKPIEEANVVETSVTSNDKVIGLQPDGSLAIAVADLPAQMNGADSVADLTVKGKVAEVCQKKGCWMTIENANGGTMRVTFKDYKLFMPKDLAGKEVVIHGFAKAAEISVADLQHYAKDAGKTEAEIAKITQPEKQLTFEADGVEIR